MADLDRIVKLEFCTITRWSAGIREMTVDYTRTEWSRRSELGVSQYRQTTTSRPVSLKDAEFRVRWPPLADLFSTYSAVDSRKFVRMEDEETGDRFLLRGVRVEGRRFAVIVASSPIYGEAGPLGDPDGWDQVGGRNP